jgi:hypothetical protein
MRISKPITISDKIAARYTNKDQSERFDKALRKILSVPHSVILEREAEYRRKAALNPNRRGRKPKVKPSASPATGV